MRKNKKGFTLIEIIVVVVILAVLMAVAVPSVLKYLNTAQTPVFDKGKNLFSLQFAKNSVTTTLILAEGYMDVIAVHQAGFENVVATLGTAITPDQARKISQYAKTVIIAYDSDAAGQAATQKAMRHFSEGCKRPR